MNMPHEMREKLIQDLVRGDHDLITLAGMHGLTATDLARWVGEPENRRVLSGVCVLADLQAQLLLSRYRMAAANRLLELTQSREGRSAGDVSRRACMDLLKVDMERAAAVALSAGEGALEQGLEARLREMLYGSAGRDAGGGSDDARSEDGLDDDDGPDDEETGDEVSEEGDNDTATG